VIVPATLTGTSRLVRFVIRRDRVRLALWVIGTVGVTIASAASLPSVYPDQASIVSYVTLFGDNPALVAFAGPGHGFGDPNIGVILVNETQLWVMIAVSLMSIFLVARQTRAEEESERAELVLASGVGRHAPTTASVLVVLAANLAVAVGSTVGFLALGYPPVGSVALGASFLAVGVVFAAVAAVSAQLTSTNRATLGLASTVLVASFVLRAVGDIGDNPAVWASPIGWGQAVRAFAVERWWTLGLCAALAVALVVTSYRLAARRDLGSGLLPQRPGRASASSALLGPIGLPARLHRGSLIGWPLGLFFTGVAYGSIGDDVDQLLVDNPEFAEFLALIGGADVTDAFFAVAMTMLAMMASGFAISTALAPRSEESAGRADPILARPVTRARWAGEHVVVALLGTVVALAAAGGGVGLGYATAGGGVDSLLRLTGAALAMAPSVFVLIGATMVLIGWAPRFALAAWGVLALSVVVDQLGEVLRLPAWTRRLSPFEHAPAVPAEPMRWLPLAVLAAVAAAAVVVGLVGLRRRDVVSR
jgi:ABC-2 type transport system permease protein